MNQRGGIEVLSYAYEEAFAEKVRALAERMRPRDLYDVINLFRNREARPAASVVRQVLKLKCDFKGISVPVLGDLTRHRPDLEGAWQPMLGHQLPSLPPVQSLWDTLPEFFGWLFEDIVPATPAAYTQAAGETIIRTRSLRLPVGNVAQSSLEVVRFAAANRLCVDLDYRGSRRRIEPYALRETRDGNIILHAWNIDSNAPRSYRVDRIQGAQPTSQPFVPRYEVELTQSGPKVILPTARFTGSDATRSRPKKSTSVRRAKTSRGSESMFDGRTYVYECGLCGKKFRRKKQTSTLNPHKTRDGYPCPGRTGFWADTQ